MLWGVSGGVSNGKGDIPKKSPPELVRMPDCFVTRSVTAFFAKAGSASAEPVITLTL